jgi:hypothetical protein
MDRMYYPLRVLAGSRASSEDLTDGEIFGFKAYSEPEPVHLGLSLNPR